MAVSSANETTEEGRRFFLATTLKEGVQAIVVLDGVEASRKTRVMEWVDEDPVETHAGDTGQVRLPILGAACQKGKKVVNPRCVARVWMWHMVRWVGMNRQPKTPHYWRLDQFPFGWSGGARSDSEPVRADGQVRTERNRYRVRIRQNEG